MVQSGVRPRTLGDKLQILAALSPHDVKAVEQLVDYRIRAISQEEYDRIRAASKSPGIHLVGQARAGARHR